MSHLYNNDFYDYIEKGARSSAQALISALQPWLQAKSVLDLGSGRGVWVAEWMKAGVTDGLAVDGDYVDRDQLAVPKDCFRAADLTAPVDLGRRFDVAQSLEVGEHLPQAASQGLVASLTKHADIVVFSAAVPGQGGEFHINERPLSFWQGLFAEHGYRAFDCLRPVLKDAAGVEPWYRYNSVVYANDEGRKKLPPEVLATEVPADQKLALAGSAAWRLRLAVVSLMPRAMVTWIAKMRAARIAQKAKAAKHG